jgi:L-iditol 2-dehydrogenase
MPERLAQAARLGADRVVNPAQEDLGRVIADETDNQGADVVIVAAPAHAAQESALQLAGISGRINFFGGLPKDRSIIQFDSNIVHYKELHVTATSACSTANCMQATEILTSGQIDLSPLISHRFPLSEAIAAFSAAQEYKSLKVVLEP